MKLRTSDYKIRYYYINADVKFSVIDSWIMANKNKTFKFGDILGLRGGCGFCRQKHYENKNISFSPLLDIEYSYGAFAGFNNHNIGAFLKYERSIFLSTRDNSYRTNIISGIFMYNDEYYGEIRYGQPIEKDGADYLNSLFGLSFRYYEKTGGNIREFIGVFTVFIDKDRNDALNSWGLLYGFGF